jgi:hypothetical protein
LGVRLDARTRSVGALVVLLLLLPACEEACPLGTAAVQLAVEARDGTPMVAATVAFAEAGEAPMSWPCRASPSDGNPEGAVDCDALALALPFDGPGRHTLAIDVTSPGFEPGHAEVAIEADRCGEPTETQSRTLSLEWLPLAEICEPFCVLALSCSADQPWDSVESCAEDCEADLAGPAIDECHFLYRGLRACLGAATCDDYFAFEHNDPAHACVPYVAAIDACEG